MYKLNVDVAVRELERESLKGIMEFIWEQVDQDEIRKKEGDRLAELVKQKKDTHNDVRQQLEICTYTALTFLECTWCSGSQDDWLGLHTVCITYVYVLVAIIVFCLLSSATAS